MYILFISLFKLTCNIVRMLSKRYGPIKHARQIIALFFGSRNSPMIMDYFRTMEIFAFRKYLP